MPYYVINPHDENTIFQLTSQLVFLWAIFLHVIVCFTPATLLALANYQTIKARNVANAINWAARKQYNTAIAKKKSRLAQRGTPSKTRIPRHFTDDQKDQDRFRDIRPIDNSISENNEVDDIDYPVDDSFMIHERSPEHREYHFTYMNPMKPFEVYSQEFSQTPENVEAEYLTQVQLTTDKTDTFNYRLVQYFWMFSNIKTNQIIIRFNLSPNFA